MNLNSIFLLIYVFFLSLTFYILKKFGKNVEYNILYGIFRIGDRIGFLEKISKSFLSKILEILAIPTGFLAMFFSIYFILYGIKAKIPTIVPVIPGIEIYGIRFPFIEIIIAIFLSALVHELSHALLVLKNKLKIKSYGIFFLGPFLGAFVEPSEDVYRIDKIKQIAIFHAGILANLLLAVLVILIGNLFHFYLVNSGNIQVIIVGKVPNTTVENISGERLLYINQFKINSLSDIEKALMNYRPGDTIELITNVSNYRIKLSNNNGKPFMGLYFTEEINNKSYRFIVNLLFWIMMISLGIGLGNALPIFILDGGQSMKALLEIIFKNEEVANKLYILISCLVIALIIVNFIVVL
ncbi:hypothetical protein BA065_02920 [Nanoarchaeota archaeon NZ13-N]|nr:MAG: hypothetical protein BA065_02920 [Nanoarchaeota archaeon NZ13-N]